MKMMLQRYRFMALLTATLTAALASDDARADFIPGNIYVAANSDDGCEEVDIGARIYEFNPATGESTLFATLSDTPCSSLSGLVFTPDGSRLRGADQLRSRIIEVDGDGNVTTVLDNGDGISAPRGGNGMDYDADGNFYVMNEGGRRILKFPANGEPAQVFANLGDGLTIGGPISIAPDGDLYWGQKSGERVLRFTGPHNEMLFDQLVSENIASLVVDSAENVFVLVGTGIYRYDNGDPSTRALLANVGGAAAFSSITLSPDESTLYVAQAGAMWSVDALTGDFGFLGVVGEVGFIEGAGSAVFVPEPATIVPIILGLPWLGRPRK